MANWCVKEINVVSNIPGLGWSCGLRKPNTARTILALVMNWTSPFLYHMDCEQKSHIWPNALTCCECNNRHASSSHLDSWRGGIETELYKLSELLRHIHVKLNFLLTLLTFIYFLTFTYVLFKILDWLVHNSFNTFTRHSIIIKIQLNFSQKW
jgi:hypothetical protein